MKITFKTAENRNFILSNKFRNQNNEINQKTLIKFNTFLIKHKTMTQLNPQCEVY